MREAYLKYYDRYSYRAVLRFSLDALLTRSRLRRRSLANRQRDYLRLTDNPHLLALHRNLNTHLLNSARQWDSYDYGEGYFYQGLPAIRVTGLRDTAARVEAMGLSRHVAGRRVLEVGCNSGFVALSIAETAAQVTGFDINPHLIGIAREAAAYLARGNTHFEVCGFEEFAGGGPFDAVLSFANHSTYDGNTRQGIEEYFIKCRDLLEPGGLLLFESHAPAHEGEGLTGVVDILSRLFHIRQQRVLTGGTFLDRGRTFIVAEK